MMAKKKKYDKELRTLFYINLAVLILIISAFNLFNQKKKDVQVLGIETNDTFWQDFVIKHPTYRDGWIELGRMDKVKEIDPNFIKP